MLSYGSAFFSSTRLFLRLFLFLFLAVLSCFSSELVCDPFQTKTVCIFRRITPLILSLLLRNHLQILQYFFSFLMPFLYYSGYIKLFWVDNNILFLQQQRNNFKKYFLTIQLFIDFFVCILNFFIGFHFSI